MVGNTKCRAEDTRRKGVNEMADTFIPLDVNSVTESEEQPSLTYSLDLDNGRIGSRIDGIQAIQQAIRKALITPRFKCLVYDDQYGSDIIAAFINATPEYIETTAKSYIEDALLPDSRILEISDVTAELKDDNCYIDFTADTIFGKVEVSTLI